MLNEHCKWCHDNVEVYLYPTIYCPHPCMTELTRSNNSLGRGGAGARWWCSLGSFPPPALLAAPGSAPAGSWPRVTLSRQQAASPWPLCWWPPSDTDTRLQPHLVTFIRVPLIHLCTYIYGYKTIRTQPKLCGCRPLKVVKYGFG